MQITRGQQPVQGGPPMGPQAGLGAPPGAHAAAQQHQRTHEAAEDAHALQQQLLRHSSTCKGPSHLPGPQSALGAPFWGPPPGGPFLGAPSWGPPAAAGAPSQEELWGLLGFG